MRGTTAFLRRWCGGAAAGLVLTFAPGAAQADEIDDAFARMTELAAAERAAVEGLPELRERVETARISFETSQQDGDADDLGSDSDAIDHRLAARSRAASALDVLQTNRVIHLRKWFDEALANTNLN